MIDTRNKRFSITHLLCPWRMTLPNPDGTLDQADRQQGQYLYAGLLWQELRVTDSPVVAESDGWGWIRGTRWDPIEGTAWEHVRET